MVLLIALLVGLLVVLFCGTLLIVLIFVACGDGGGVPFSCCPLVMFHVRFLSVLAAGLDTLISICVSVSLLGGFNGLDGART